MLKASAAFSLVVSTLMAVFMFITLNTTEASVSVVYSNTTPTMIPTMVSGVEFNQADIYVCHTPTTSAEYTIDPYTDWAALKGKNIRFVWELPVSYKLEVFRSDIALFGRYTHLSVSVEDADYQPQLNDHIVNVVLGADGNEEWAASAATAVIPDERGWQLPLYTDLAFYNPWFDNPEAWTTKEHTTVILHELGHLVGLDHTHEWEGQQVDSIMSYEEPTRPPYYLPGDIAGLQSVLCP